MPTDTAAKTATLYRMVMTDHLCPYGLKAKDLLESQGFHVEDVTSPAVMRLMRSRPSMM